MSDPQQRVWRYGLIGCGEFGRFCLGALPQVKQVCPVAVADAVVPLAEALAGDFGLRACPSVRQLISDPEIDLIHIVSPPSSHYELAMAAMQAGKHVLCEKPLALGMRQADELLETARQRGVLLAVNHVLRYSPLLAATKRVIDSGVLGRPLHAFFENYASDAKLPLEHWFWNPQISGGIFVEHGVHFFDLYAWWFGRGRVLWAGSQRREQTHLEDRAHCTVRYDNDLMAQFYHGFDQPKRLDRADHRVLLERGDIQVIGWIPMELRVHGIADEAGRAKLDGLCSDWQHQVLETYDGDRQVCRGRGREYRVTMRGQWTWRLPPEQRQAVYTQLFVSLMEDQIKKLADPDHQTLLTAQDAREAVAVAEQARNIAAEQS